eukprot:UC4_evm3s1361
MSSTLLVKFLWNIIFVITIIAPIAVAATPTHDVDDDIHIIFSTGCNAYQHWQGRITRIVSGCEKNQENLDHRRFVNHPGGKLDVIVSPDFLAKSTNSRLELHLTRAFKGSKEFPWFNKPFSIEHWAKEGSRDPDNGAVVILDPDEVFFAPITQRPLPPADLLFSEIPAKEGLNVASPGAPVGQMYGLGDSWVHVYDRESICGVGSPCLKVKPREARVHYSVGPPYIIHARDMIGLTDLWSRYMRPMAKLTKHDIITDMWAYIMASANLNMPHTRLEQYMVSNVQSGGEGWPLVDAWEGTPLSCNNPIKPPHQHYPNFIHFAQNYKAKDAKGNEWMWHKGHMPGNIMECDIPILKPPPDDLYNTQKTREGFRNAWTICHLFSTMNKMLIAYKKKFCAAKNANIEKSIRLIQQKTLPCPTNKRLCWPLAQLERPHDEPEKSIRSIRSQNKFNDNIVEDRQEHKPAIDHKPVKDYSEMNVDSHPGKANNRINGENTYAYHSIHNGENYIRPIRTITCRVPNGTLLNKFITYLPNSEEKIPPKKPKGSGCEI